MRRRRTFSGVLPERGAGQEPYSYSYPSLQALVGAALHDKSHLKDSERASRDASDSWAGASWKAAAEYAAKGDIAGARRLAPSVLEAVNSMVKNMPRLDPVYRLDEGRWIDVARYVKGEPECWGDMVESEPMPRRGAAVIVNVSAPSNIQANQLDAVGVAVGSAVLGLQAMGYMVTLYAVERTTGYGVSRPMEVFAPVNPGGAPLDVAQMSIILRPWFLRRIMFSLQETCGQERVDQFGFKMGGGYGQACRITAADAKRLTGLDNTVVVNIAEAVNNPGGVKQTILNQIKGVK